MTETVTTQRVQVLCSRQPYLSMVHNVAVTVIMA